MPNYTPYIKREYQPSITAIKDDIANRKNPDFFWPNGMQVYCGHQGSGKTISAVRHVAKLSEKYPKMLLVSNLHLSFKKAIPYRGERLDFILENINPEKHYIQFHSMSELSKLLVDVNNDFYGVTYLIDEIHTYFNALDSKNIPMYVFTEISQQRKQRKLIIGTSQLFMRMAKPFREQCDSIIWCKTRGGIFTSQEAWDGATVTQDFDGTIQGNVKKRGFFIQSRKIRNLFDTYQKVISGKEQYEEITPDEARK